MSSNTTGVISANTAEAATRQVPTRKLSVDPKAAEALERHLSQRPEKTELIDRNILKDDKVAPSLQAARDKLQRSQLEDKLDQALLQRPKREELVREGILADADTQAETAQ